MTEQQIDPNRLVCVTLAAKQWSTVLMMLRPHRVAQAIVDSLTEQLQHHHRATLQSLSRELPPVRPGNVIGRNEIGLDRYHGPND